MTEDQLIDRLDFPFGPTINPLNLKARGEIQIIRGSDGRLDLPMND